VAPDHSQGPLRYTLERGILVPRAQNDPRSPDRRG
jgi:hypothetical protein